MDSFKYPKSVEHYHQMELPVKTEIIPDDRISEIHALLKSQSELAEQNQGSIQSLSLEVAEIVMILYQQQQFSSIGAIEAIKQETKALSGGVMRIYQHLEKNSFGKELKTGQQNLQKTIEANQRNTTYKVGYLDWKQIATIITATAIVSSLCSLAVFQLASSFKTDQKTSIPVEKPLKSKVKKASQ
jgi:hypothetical protein